LSVHVTTNTYFATTSFRFTCWWRSDSGSMFSTGIEFLTGFVFQMTLCFCW